MGDSVVNDIDEKRLSKKHGNSKDFHFSGARIEDIIQYIIPIIRKQPDYLILHVRTKDATTNTSKKIVDDLLILKSNILKQLPSCRIVLSKPIIRHDIGKANLTIRNAINIYQLYSQNALKTITSAHNILDGKDYI